MPTFSSTAAQRPSAAILARVAHGQLVSEWVSDQIRVRGVRECAAVFATMEADIDRYALAEAYRARYPNRAELLDELLTAFDWSTGKSKS